MRADTFETIRLIDYEKKTQAEAAASMGVARTTVQRLYRSARSMIADALIEGIHIVVETDETIDFTPDTGEDILRKDVALMKVAFALQGENIAQHYGKAEKFLLVTLEKGKVVRKDTLITEADTMGGCRRFMMSLGVEAVIAEAMAANAHKRYLESGMKVYGAAGAVDEAVKRFAAGDLSPLSNLTEDTDCHGETGPCHEDEKEDACCEEKKSHSPSGCCHD